VVGNAVNGADHTAVRIELSGKFFHFQQHRQGTSICLDSS
jgi:hypothetical protein